MLLLLLFQMLSLTVYAATPSRYFIYLSGSHNVLPHSSHLTQITHVSLAFLGSSLFNQEHPSTPWPLFTTVDSVRAHFAPETKVTVAIGGWGDTAGYSAAAATSASRRRFAANVARMVEELGADGVDIDWEYPAGNGEDYKLNPNSAKKHELTTYPLLLSEIRQTLGPSKIISAAVPGLRRDMLAFTRETIPLILSSLDFLNIMTYDLMNRRDNVTGHHAGTQLSLEAVDAYHAVGVPHSMMNVGFAWYVKWYRTDGASRSSCIKHPVGCKTALMEDPATGADLGKAGAFSWHDVHLGMFPPELRESHERAMQFGVYDDAGGGWYYFDAEEDLWWSWETPWSMGGKFEEVVKGRGVGGVFPWALGEDAPAFEHLYALNAYMKRKENVTAYDEL